LAREGVLVSRFSVQAAPRPAPPAVSIRYDELAVRYEATVQIAAIKDWL
jgi:hypothetical protein